MELDYWAHYYYENPSSDEVEDEDFNLEEVLAQMEEDDWEEI
jgi:hypothetical protein